MNFIDRKPTRLKYFNYSNPYYYFLTICTHDRNHLFGSIKNCEMILNEAGRIADKYLLDIPVIYNFIELDEYVIMPNHLHLIMINNKQEEDSVRSSMIISRVINQYKGTCTKTIREKYKNNKPIWQKSFYDRIIRNEKELQKIREYIRYNPLKWGLEKDNPENLLI